MIAAACAVIITVLTVTALVLGSFQMLLFAALLVFILAPEVRRRAAGAVRVRRHLERDRAAFDAELAALLDPDSDERTMP
jgi:ABC-type transport system involved in cytochrome bd biosynthesis fused ATPase/permease subunit